jgi:hypothetical protein
VPAGTIIHVATYCGIACAASVTQYSLQLTSLFSAPLTPFNLFLYPTGCSVNPAINGATAERCELSRITWGFRLKDPVVNVDTSYSRNSAAENIRRHRICGYSLHS